MLKEISMRTIHIAVAVVSIGLLFGACSRTTISPNWGIAYQDMRTKQALDPMAGENLDPVEGQNGRVNATAMEAYRKGFEKPETDFDRSIVSSGVKTR
jgi:hypothetical protein